MPVINIHIPGSGITPFNVWDLPFRYWRQYREIAAHIVDELTKETKKSGR